MASIVILGAGMVGLPTAMLLAKDGHDVTVVERDPAPPTPPGDAWEQWQRRGVNQFRQLHFLMARWREVAELELPELVAALDDAGALRFAALPPSVAPAPGDEAFVTITARRPVLEAAAATAVADTPGITVRRGAAAVRLLGTVGADGVLRATGVGLDDGTEIPADLVVDAGGRRSPVPDLVSAAGGRRPVEVGDDSGFVYYGRHYRSNDGTLPEVRGNLLQTTSTFSILTLPADHGTWGIGIIAAAGDRALRAAKDPARWEAVVRAVPAVAHWIDAEPLDAEPAVMAGIEDRIRHFVVDGEPVVTGVVPVGDAWACTNPSLGRGITIGLLQAVALRDTVRRVGTDDARALALAYDAATEEAVGGWYRATLEFDRRRLAEIHAAVAGDEPAGEAGSDIGKAVFRAAGKDDDVLRAVLRINHLLATPEEVFSGPGLLKKVVELGADWRDAPPTGPDRAELLAILGGS